MRRRWEARSQGTARGVQPVGHPSASQRGHTPAEAVPLYLPPPTEVQAVIKICESCVRLIEDDENYTSYTPDRPTSAGFTFYRHVQPCPESWPRTARLSVRR